LKPLADALLEQARKIPEDKRTETDFLDLTQLGTDLAAKLPKEVAVGVRKAFHSLGVNVLRLRTLPEQMFYDKTLLVVEAAKPVELILENPDAMQHNWVLVVPGALEEIGMAADKMAPVADSQGRTFVPDSPKVLVATKLLNAGESTRLRFTAPSQPDKYPYACTFPGHWQRMRGTLLVVRDLDEYLSQPPAESDAPTITEWKLADLVPELPKLTSARSVEKGKELFVMAGCVACHKIGDIGTPYGPDLKEVFAKYKGNAEAVLAEILDPSKNIEPRYRPYTFKPANGEEFIGLIVKEEGDALAIQTGPSDAAIQKLSKKDIKSREPQASSLMPAGLLNLLNKEQILDLLAFLQSGGDRSAASAK
jgi:putative heme-binding domain-containing protein